MRSHQISSQVNMHTTVIFVIATLYSGSVAGSLVRNQNSNVLISEGDVTSPSSVPWNAALYSWSVAAGYEQFCSGTLITPTYVLTAAHCFHEMNSSDVRVALGKLNRAYYNTVGQDVQYFNVTRLFIYPRYNSIEDLLQFDIALVELADPANLSSSVQLARVDLTPGFPANGTSGLVAGWGSTENDYPSEKVCSITLPYVDPESCYKNIPSYNRHFLTLDKFCAGFMNQNKSVCAGNSGAGFVVKDPVTGQFFVRGIFSVVFRPENFPRDSCYNTYYTGYTHVGQELYVNWLTETVPQLKTAALATDCGRQLNIAIEEFNGRNVTVGDQPWNVVIYKKRAEWSADQKTYIWSSGCIGTLITPSHVVAMASCVTDRAGRVVPASSSRLAAGKLHPHYDTAEPDTQTRGVRTVQVHQQFNQTDRLHDIALLEADYSFSLSWRISPACVDWTGQLPAQTSAVTTAWTRFTFATQPYTLLSRGQCPREVLASNKYIHSNTICARQRGEETCYSTDGPGLMVRHTDTRGAVRYYLLGVYSGQLEYSYRGGCFYDRLNAFTDLSPYTAWLQHHVAKPQSSSHRTISIADPAFSIVLILKYSLH